MLRILHLLFILSLFGCEVFVLETKTLTLSGKYVLNRLDVTNVDQPTEKDSLYIIGDIFVDKETLPYPFDSMVMNRFYIHLDEASIRMNWIGVDFGGRDIWEYGQSPNYIFYSVLNNNTYNNGYIQFTYKTKQNIHRTLTFHIEHDGLEDLQLKTTGSWVRGKDGGNKILTFYFTRVGP